MNKCDGGCGRTPEVYGSSWCSSCYDALPEFTKDRILRLRNALIEVAHGRNRRKVQLHLIAADALTHPTVTVKSSVSG
jgi:hypothetical protein